MNHAEMQDALGAYADGELDAARRSALDAHLASCAECRSELEALRELDSAIHSQPVPDPGPQYWSRFAERVAAHTESQAAPEGVRFYERLTGWLFPHERFAWARAATALAACTLLVTLGLRGFRPVTTPTPAPSEIASPPVAETRGTSEAPPVPTRGPRPSPHDVAPRPEEPVTSVERTEPVGDRDASARARDAASREVAESRRETAAVPAPPIAQQAAPEPAADAAVESFAKAAPKREATESRGVAADTQQSARPPATEPRATETKDEAGAAVRSEPSPASRRALAPREIAVAPPAAKSVLDSLVTSVQPVEPGDMRRATYPLARVQLTPSTPPVDSLLALDARLWPRRDDPALRAQMATLASDLAARAGDPRARPRAVAWLEHLAATSSDASERERWQRMLGSLGDR